MIKNKDNILFYLGITTTIAYIVYLFENITYTIIYEKIFWTVQLGGTTNHNMTYMIEGLKMNDYIAFFIIGFIILGFILYYFKKKKITNGMVITGFSFLFLLSDFFCYLFLMFDFFDIVQLEVPNILAYCTLALTCLSVILQFASMMCFWKLISKDENKLIKIFSGIILIGFIITNLWVVISFIPIFHISLEKLNSYIVKLWFLTFLSVFYNIFWVLFGVYFLFYKEEKNNSEVTTSISV